MVALRKLATTAIVCLFVFLALNYHWTHAALAAIVNTSGCPSNLEENAKKNIASLYGKRESSPVFVCLQKSVLGLKVSHGKTTFAPLLPSIVVLGPQGMNVDVASHEYAHAELAQRTSILLRTYRIPTWFDEGLAMQLDHRLDYSRTALLGYISNDNQPLELSEISTPSTFYTASNRGKAHYAFSKCIIGEWSRHNEHSRMLKLIREVNWFDEFPEDQFQKYEKTCLQ